MLKEKLKDYNIILASGSPRRQEFFKQLDIDFEIRLKSVEEVYPSELKHIAISDFLAKIKANALIGGLNEKDILITSDTIVWHNDQAIGKPKNEIDAFNMLKSLSGDIHEVITSVCFTQKYEQKIVNAVTSVRFKELSDDEIWYYIHNFKPMDKAGAYGIQDWIGQIAVTHIEGSYFNVMGLPVHLVYKTLLEIAQK
jgi:septum formation protein